MPGKRKPTPTDTTLDIDGVRRGAVAVVLKPILYADNKSGRMPDDMLAEAVGLAEAISLRVVCAEFFNVPKPVPATLMGSGQVERWQNYIAAESVQLVVIDHVLSPVQQRNLERNWKCKVIDRTGLILEIFGERARTREGQLQVELASLNYQKSRLVRSWTHLERQRGGFGFMGGPGESQLEIDRRLIMARLAKLKVELSEVQRTRGLSREARRKAEHPTIALVGYTNAGKSTLFNQLTGAEVLAKNMLFATLDPTMRGFKLPGGGEVVLSDTVGFIADLPTNLVEAFKATLEEVQLADVILHVRDIAHPETKAQKESVENILADLGISAGDQRLIEVLNKFDLLPAEEKTSLQGYTEKATWDAQNAYDVDGLRQEARGGIVAVSALTGEGLPSLLRLIEENLSARCKGYRIMVSVEEGAALAWLHAHGTIQKSRNSAKSVTFQIDLSDADFGRFNTKFAQKLGKSIQIKL